MDSFINSVKLDSELCKGCTHCIKRCPTQAIRVRGGKAHIIKPFCIDCGECIRVCPHHAKKAAYDTFDILKKFEYKIALPAPSFYAQFNNLDDPNIVLRALKLMGFDDVFEVAAAAELVSDISRKYIEEHADQKPFISTACPSVIKLIRVKFPNLIEHLLPINAPMDIAAQMAKRIAIRKTGLPAEKIGAIFISPCPAKVTAVKSPIVNNTCEVDGVLPIKEVYTKILPYMKEAAAHNVYSDDDIGGSSEDLSMSGKIGISWGASGGESGGLLTDNYLAADGIENVLKVLEDLEDQKITGLDFIELNACSGGCVGGVLQVENPYVAKAKLKALRKYMPVARSHIKDSIPDYAFWGNDLEYMPVFNLGSDFMESLEKMSKAEEIEKRLPGLDCGSCGAPSCKALAEDIVRGVAHEKDCIFLLRDYIHRMTDELKGL